MCELQRAFSKIQFSSWRLLNLAAISSFADVGGGGGIFSLYWRCCRTWRGRMGGKEKSASPSSVRMKSSIIMDDVTEELFAKFSSAAATNAGRVWIYMETGFGGHFSSIPISSPIVSSWKWSFSRIVWGAQNSWASPRRRQQLRSSSQVPPAGKSLQQSHEKDFPPTRFEPINS